MEGSCWYLADSKQLVSVSSDIHTWGLQVEEKAARGKDLALVEDYPKINCRRSRLLPIT